ncbi:MAG: hypothetical protein M1547_05675 [Gammaproteobacteria bacterium]|nr:hypothetical protein [Gammaproteobacteria bacterium]
MPEPLDFAAAAARARAIAAALALGRSLDLWSLALTALALATLLWIPLLLPPTIGLLLSLLAGGTQKILALRVAFDEALFRHWAETWSDAATQGFASAALVEDLAALDQSIAACGLRAPSGGAVRELDGRLRGAGKLLRRQILAFVIQFVSMVAVLVVMRLPIAG